jgi:hypothetical protein
MNDLNGQKTASLVADAIDRLELEAPRGALYEARATTEPGTAAG